MSTSLPPILALPFPGYGKEVKSIRETELASAFSHSTDEQGNEGKVTAPTTDEGEIDAASTWNRIPRFNLLYSGRKGSESIALMKRKGKMTPVLTPSINKEGDDIMVVPILHTIFRKCVSQLPSSGNGKNDVIFTKKAAIMSNKKSFLWLPPPLLKKTDFVLPPAISSAHTVDGRRVDELMSKSIVIERAKKKLKKKSENLMTRVCEKHTKDNFSCCNGGISNESLEKIDKMLRKFRYIGNKKLQEPPDYVESDIDTANATSTKVGKIEESKNKRRIQQFVVGQEDEALCDLSVSVSKKTKRQQKVTTLHAPCPELVLGSTPQEARKHRKMIPHLAVGKSDMVHKHVRCQRRRIMTKEEKRQDCYRRVNPDNKWDPPDSPYELLQEDHSFDPWRVLVICMLLNQTTGAQVKKVLARVFLVCPTPEAAVQVPDDELAAVISSLGLQNKRARDIREMSRQYLEDCWTHVTELHGVGKYAADAYAIFCVGKPEDVVPDDHMLVKYWVYVVQWRRERPWIFNC